MRTYGAKPETDPPDTHTTCHTLNDIDTNPLSETQKTQNLPHKKQIILDGFLRWFNSRKIF